MDSDVEERVKSQSLTAKYKRRTRRFNRYVTKHQHDDPSLRNFNSSSSESEVSHFEFYKSITLIKEKP